LNTLGIIHEARREGDYRSALPSDEVQVNLDIMRRVRLIASLIDMQREIPNAPHEFVVGDEFAKETAIGAKDDSLQPLRIEATFDEAVFESL
jgi:hypothetical protein